MSSAIFLYVAMYAAELLCGIIITSFIIVLYVAHFCCIKLKIPSEFIPTVSILLLRMLNVSSEDVAFVP